MPLGSCSLRDKFNRLRRHTSHPARQGRGQRGLRRPGGHVEHPPSPQPSGEDPAGRQGEASALMTGHRGRAGTQCKKGSG